MDTIALTASDKKAAYIMVEMLETDASPEGIIYAFQQLCQARCPAHAPSFLDRMKAAIDNLFD